MPPTGLCPLFQPQASGAVGTSGARLGWKWALWTRPPRQCQAQGDTGSPRGCAPTWVRSTSLPLHVGCVSMARRWAMSSQCRCCSSRAASARCWCRASVSAVTAWAGAEGLLRAPSGWAGAALQDLGPRWLAPQAPPTCLAPVPQELHLRGLDVLLLLHHLLHPLLRRPLLLQAPLRAALHPLRHLLGQGPSQPLPTNVPGPSQARSSTRSAGLLSGDRDMARG